MAILTLPEAKSLIETDRSDTELQSLLNATETEIVRSDGELDLIEMDVAGETVTVVGDQTAYGDAEDYVIRLADRASSIEAVEYFDGDSWIEYENDNDQNWRSKAHIVERWIGGYRWRVRYKRVKALDLRKDVQADLIRLRLAFSGYASTSTGAYSESHVNHREEEARILRRLGDGSIY